MKHIKNKFDKHDIPNLPKVSFEGRIFVIVSEQEAERAVDYLLSQPILGFDTETKPSFKPGAGMHKVALLQVSSPDTCFLFRLNQMGMPPCIIRLLEDTSVLKIGLSWHDDLMQLRRRQAFQPGTYTEIQQLVNLIGIKDLSLQKIYANLFGQKISKTQRLTNWEADVLSPSQLTYAATDAWACIQIYNEIMRLDETKDYELEIVPEPEPVVPTVIKDSAEVKTKDNDKKERDGHKRIRKRKPRKKKTTEVAAESEQTKPRVRRRKRKSTIEHPTNSTIPNTSNTTKE